MSRHMMEPSKLSVWLYRVKLERYMTDWGWKYPQYYTDEVHEAFQAYKKETQRLQEEVSKMLDSLPSNLK